MTKCNKCGDELHPFNVSMLDICVPCRADMTASVADKIKNFHARLILDTPLDLEGASVIAAASLVPTGESPELESVVLLAKAVQHYESQTSDVKRASAKLDAAINDATDRAAREPTAENLKAILGVP